MILKNIKDLSLEKLEEELVNLGEKKFRAKQIFKWIHTGVRDFDSMTDISVELREILKSKFDLCIYNIIDKQVSKDGSVKYLFELPDKNTIECVVMKYKYGNSICVSTQVGCKMGCKFCASTLNGLVRNLSCGEILEQIIIVNKEKYDEAKICE